MTKKKLIWYRVVLVGLAAIAAYHVFIILLRLAARYTAFLWNLV